MAISQTCVSLAQILTAKDYGLISCPIFCFTKKSFNHFTKNSPCWTVMLILWRGCKNIVRKSTRVWTSIGFLNADAQVMNMEISNKSEQWTRINRLVATEVRGGGLVRRGELDFVGRWGRWLWSFFEGRKEKLVIESALLFFSYPHSSFLFPFITQKGQNNYQTCATKQEGATQQKRTNNSSVDISDYWNQTLRVEY